MKTETRSQKSEAEGRRAAARSVLEVAGWPMDVRNRSGEVAGGPLDVKNHSGEVAVGPMDIKKCYCEVAGWSFDIRNQSGNVAGWPLDVQDLSGEVGGAVLCHLTSPSRFVVSNSMSAPSISRPPVLRRI